VRSYVRRPRTSHARTGRTSRPFGVPSDAAQLALLPGFRSATGLKDAFGRSIFTGTSGDALPAAALPSLARTSAPRVTHPRSCRSRSTRRCPRIHVCANAGTTVLEGRTVPQRVGAERVVWDVVVLGANDEEDADVAKAVRAWGFA